jgi:Sulfatase
MSYPLRDGSEVSVNDLKVLAEITSGENAVVRTLKANDYQYIHGGSDWWGDRCGAEVDLCLESPLVDVTTFDLLRTTPLGFVMFPEAGDPGTAVTMQRIEDLANWDEIESSLPEGPKFVFLHLILPHPPLYMDASCTPNPGPERSQRLLNEYPFLDPQLLALRKAAYVEQIECANDVTRRLIEAVPDDSVVVVTADHGPDSRAQLRIDSSLWDEGAKLERYSTLTSMRLPTECPEAEDDLDLVNIFRLVLGCLLDGDELVSLPSAYYATPPACCPGPLVEIEDPDLFSTAPNRPKYTSAR